MFICGSGSFTHEDEHDHHEPISPTTKRSKRSTSFCKLIGKDNSNKNPFADRGLDKFYALLADLDDKKQKIYTQKGSEDISFVRFVYTNDSDRVKPIVVKVRDKTVPRPNLTAVKPSPSPANQDADKISTAAENQTVDANPKKEEPTAQRSFKKKRCLRCNASFKLETLRRPNFYFPVIVVLILLFLAMYGRSFAILCTSIGWYMVPSVVGGESDSSANNERKPKRKKEYVRKQSDKMIHHVQKEFVRKQSDKKMVSEGSPVSPKSVINGLN